jgi:hypothetical protein
MATFATTRPHRAIRRRRSRSQAASSPLRTFINFVFYLGLGAAIGLGSAWYLLDNGISLDSIRLGPWLLRADAGQPIADPYTSAYVARSGHIPIRLDGAMYFLAERAGGGEPLRGECSYTVAGPALDGAWWAISLHRPDGSLIENPAKRYSFSESSIDLQDNGTFRIAIAPRARPGNWLPTGGHGPFVLVLRIHGPDPTYVKAPRSVPVPALELEGCP